MPEDNMDEVQVLETEPTEAATETAEEQSSLTPEQIKELQDKAAKADDLEKKNKQLFERVKKGDKPEISLADVMALRDVHEEDLDTVQEWAKFKNISLADAKKDSILQTILATNAEQRRTAAATHTGTSQRSATAPSGADLLAKAMRTNELPDDDAGMEAIAAARVDALRKKAR